MSKQKIREWLDIHGYEGAASQRAIAHIIHKYTQDQSGWVSVEEYFSLLADGELCWVLFPDSTVKLCRLNDYKQFGGPVDFWQDMNGNDLFMNSTMFIKIGQPLPPEEEA